MASIEGADEFGEFAENTQGLADDVDRILEEALEEIATELIGSITRQLMRRDTEKGGTLDSRTSPYEPGGENSSSEDSYHISETSAWQYETISGSEPAVVVTPKPAVQDRAYWLDQGTKDHFPDGDNPMYFYVNGIKIVLTEDDGYSGEDLRQLGVGSGRDNAARLNEETPTTGETNQGEPKAVSGVEPQNYFQAAVLALLVGDKIERALESAWEDAVRRNFGEV